MLRRVMCGALLVALALTAAAGGTAAAPSQRPQPPVAEDEALLGRSPDNPYPSPRGLLLHGTHGYRIVIDALSGERGHGAKAFVGMAGTRGALKYLVPANVKDEGVHASFGRYGRVDLRWVPNGGVREVSGHCGGGVLVHFYFATGSYVGSVRVRGGGGFTQASAQRIQWHRGWYPRDYGCPRTVSEGSPGRGVILEAEGIKDFEEPVHLAVLENQPGQRVRYGARQTEEVGRMQITRFAYVRGAPKTLTVGHGFRTAEITPPAPFSGTGTFARTGHAHGTWLGDLAVEFPDHEHAALAGRDFEATLHSGPWEESGRR